MPPVTSRPAPPGLPPAVVINLDRSPERLARATAAFAEMGIELERFAAVDASRDTERCAGAVHDRMFQLFVGRAPLAGEIGCALSHFGVWDSLARRDGDMLLVVEDDALPDALIAQLPAAIKALPDDWEILLLAQNYSKQPVWRAQAGSFELTRYHRPGYLAVGYVVHRRILRRRHLWTRPRPVRFPIDRWRFWTMWYGLAVYASAPSSVHPPLFGSPGPLQSTIGGTAEVLRRAGGLRGLPHRLWRVPLHLTGLARLPGIYLRTRLSRRREGGRTAG